MNLQHTHDLFWHRAALQWSLPTNRTSLSLSAPGCVSFHFFLPRHQAHYLPLYLPLPSPLSLLLPLHTRLHSHLRLYIKPPPFSTTCRWQQVQQQTFGIHGGGLLFAVSRASVTLSNPGCRWGIYTHGKLIPMPCLLHIVLVSEGVHCVETGVTSLKDSLWEAITLRKQHGEEVMESGGPNEWRDLENKRKRIKHAG